MEEGEVLRSLCFTALFLCFGLVQVYGAESPCEHDAQNFRCVGYVKNYDGDTLTVNIPGVHPLIGKSVAVRVNGIDTAEIKTKDSCEKQASRTARRLAKNLLKNAKRIDLENVKRGKYFRIVADVRVDGQLLSDLLIKNKLAVAYSGGTKEKVNWCQMIGSEKALSPLD